jgi:hypothetical protein
MEQALSASNGIGQEHALTVVVNNTPATKISSKPFIEANTIEASIDEIQTRHIIPTYRDSEALLSQAKFIEITSEVVGICSGQNACKSLLFA